jgi:hypothetical protein
VSCESDEALRVTQFDFNSGGGGGRILKKMSAVLCAFKPFDKKLCDWI